MVITGFGDNDVLVTIMNLRVGVLVRLLRWGSRNFSVACGGEDYGW